jgi:hypothetical protein
VTLGLRTTAAACIAASILIMPVVSEAQARRAVPRTIHSRPVVRPGIYYAPSVYYRPWYASGYYGSPYFYGFYGGWGYPYYPYYGPWGYGPYYGGYYDISGSMRLQVSPRETEVFVDGYYAGTVDDFDGVFQRLHLEPGEHDLELFLPGHRSYQQKIYLQPGRTFSVRHGMETLSPGDAQPVRPAGAPRPAAGSRSRSAQRLPPIRPRDRDAGADRDANAASTPSEFGSLVLRVQPDDATVTIDGDEWENSGDSGRLIVQLGPGVHNVQIRKDGYRTYMTDITVRPGETTTLNVAMTKQ